ncbi:hypothetical protein [Adhaeribacter soli]|uniref:DUF1795 domain-containing protein n=1 Tax=Adhaeribacter soli TaxID=2607655 RepID=A0A5N1J587_9BACT|nr:hypothetical protein [Adhaeribacter soli]KAA9345860.1 hypothetical protein F0P94_01900 [Adhaeribacter soli]
MKKLLLLLCLLYLGFSAVAQHYDKYCNNLYSFCIDIPGNFNRVGATKTSEGQHFTSKDGSKLEVYGAPNLQNETLKQRFDRELAALTNDSSVAHSTQLPTIEKAELHENSFTIQFQNQNFTNLIYRKLENNAWKSIELHYPTAKGKEYAERAKRMIGSFK